MRDRLPPHSPEAEQGALGCLLCSPASCIPEAIEAGLTHGHFYDLRHQKIYETILKVGECGEIADLIGIAGELRSAGQLESVGGFAYLNQLADSIPSSANLPYYLGILGEQHRLREMLKACTAGVAKIYDLDGTPAAEVIDEIERDVLGIRDGAGSRQEAPSIRELVQQANFQLEDSLRGITGVPGGILPLDNITQGFQPGEMAIIAARPSVGKTAILLHFARHCVLSDPPIPVGYITCEMSGAALTKRMLCAEAHADSRHVVGWTNMDYARVTNASLRMASAPMHVREARGMSILEIRAVARRMVQQHGIKVLMVDYLQLVSGSGGRNRTRQDDIAEVSGGLKSLAMSLGIPVVSACQINRESERDGRRPRLSDLRESGSIEQDADFVATLFRSTTDEKEIARENATKIYPVTLNIAKHRNGESGGDLRLMFHARHQRYELIETREKPL